MIYDDSLNDNYVTPEYYFSTPVYITKQPKFIDVVRSIAIDNIASAYKDKEMNSILPCRMSGSLMEDERIVEFADFVASTSWNVLQGQGYDMDNFNTMITEMWCQEHFQTSSMDYHVHGGNYIVGCYFLDVPEGAPPMVIHDPRPARMMLDLPQKDITQPTLASTEINFNPEEGMMIFAPAWLAHSFGRNRSLSPFRFVHFNVSVFHAPVNYESTAEVV